MVLLRHVQWPSVASYLLRPMFFFYDSARVDRDKRDERKAHHFNLDPRDMILSIQTGFGFVRAAVA